MGKKVTKNTVDELLQKIEELQIRLNEAEEALNAIRSGEVDAIIVSDQAGDKVFTLTSADTPYRIILEEMAEGAVIIKADGTILYYNQRFSEIYYDFKSLNSGSNIYEVISVEEKNKFNNLLKQGLSARVTSTFSYRSSMFESPLYLNLALRPLPSEVAGDICIIISDVTKNHEYQYHLYELVNLRTRELQQANQKLSNDLIEIKNAQEALRISEERFRLALKNAPVGVAIQDVNLVYQWTYNQKTHRPEEIIGKTDADLFTQEDMEWINPLKQSLLESGKEKYVERWLQSNGKRVFLGIYYEVIKDSSGTVTGIGAATVDLTERKISEELVLHQKSILEGINCILDAAITSRTEYDLGLACLEIAQKITQSKFGFIGEINKEGLEDIAISNPGWDACNIIDEKGHKAPSLGFKLHGIYGRVLLDGKSLFTNHPSDHPDSIGTPADHPPIESFLGVPLIAEGKTVGIITLGNRPEGFSEKEVEALETLAPFVVEAFARKRADEALKLSEERFSKAFKNSPIAIAITRLRDGKIIEGNESFYALLGYNHEEVVGKTSLELGIWKDTASRLKLADSLVAKGSINNEDFELRKKDLTTVPVNLSVSLITIDNQECCLCTFFDLTESRRAEAVMTRYQIITQYARDPLMLIDLEGRIIEANQAALDLYGYSREELSELSITQLRGQDNPEKIRSQMQQASSKGILFEAMHRCKDGNMIAVEVSSRGVIVEGRQMILSIIRDITDRKRAENEIHEAQAKLAIALENGNIGIWEWNLKTDEVIWDERLEKMFGFQPGTFDKTFKAFENLIHEEDLPHVHQAIKESLDNDLPYETIFRTNPINGKTKYFSTKGFATKDIYGKPINLIGVGFDITSLREGTEKLVVKLNEDLLRSNKELASFAYVASHDLQEPLRMVTSFTQLLEQKYKDKLDPDALEYIHYAVDGAKRMYDLLNGLLAYSRIQTKGKSFSSIDLNKVLEKVTKNLAMQIHEKSAAIEIEELPIIHADESQMIQLFQNLMSNSLKFSSGPPKIHISSISDTVNNIISVKDDGIGIEPEYFDRIFQIFQRLLPKEEYDGTGIGLALCKRIVERHGGKIWLESKIGKGTTFFFSIPKDYKLLK